MASGPYSTLMRFILKVAAPRAGGELTDGELLARFAAERDESAFTLLVQRHGPMVLGVCRSILNDAHDADDVFQATFLVLVRKAPSISKPESVASWLHGVAYRLSQKARSAAARRRTQERQAPTMSGAETDDEAIWRDLRPVLHDEVNRLPERYRKPFVLCYLEGKTNEEAAEILGWPKGTVLSSLSRARERLRERLTRRGVALSAGMLTTLLSQQTAPAAVPGALVEATLKSAVLYAAGSAVAGAGMSAQVLAHTHGLLQDMMLARVKLVAALMLLVGAATAGAGFVYYHHRSGEIPTGVVASPPTQPASAPVLDEPAEILVPPAEEPVRPDRELLLGPWHVFGSEQNGKPIDEFVKGDRLVLTNDDFSMNSQKGEPIRLFRKGLTTGRFVLDPAARPRRIDFVDKNRTLLGIYLLEGKTLKICIGDPDSGERPTDFVSKADDRQMLLLLRRQ